MDSYFESYGTANDARSSKRILITASGADHKQRRGVSLQFGPSSPCRAWASSTQGRSGPTTGFTSGCLRDGHGKELAGAQTVALVSLACVSARRVARRNVPPLPCGAPARLCGWVTALLLRLRPRW